MHFHPQNTQHKLSISSSAILTEKIASLSLVEFIMSWASLKWIGEDEYGEHAPYFFLSSFFGTICFCILYFAFWYNLLHHARHTHQALLLESFLHGFKVWWYVSAILATAYYLRVLPHSTNQSPDIICLADCSFSASVFLSKAFELHKCRNSRLSAPLFVAYCALFSTASIHVTFFYWNNFLQKLHILFLNYLFRYKDVTKDWLCFFSFYAEVRSTFVNNWSACPLHVMKDLEIYAWVRIAHFQTTQRRWHLTVDFSDTV